jgi:predicted DNA-binding transcriptional regulator AlpA
MKDHGTASMAAPLAFSVRGFCAAHGISRTLFYKLLQSGDGPEVFRVGRRILISSEAAAEWRERLTSKGRQKS